MAYRHIQHIHHLTIFPSDSRLALSGGLCVVVVAVVRLLRALVSSSFIPRSDRVGSRNDADAPSKHAHQHQELRPAQPNQPNPAEFNSTELGSTGLDRTELNSTQSPARSGTHTCTQKGAWSSTPNEQTNNTHTYVYMMLDLWGSGCWLVAAG